MAGGVIVVGGDTGDQVRQLQEPMTVKVSLLTPQPVLCGLRWVCCPLLTREYMAALSWGLNCFRQLRRGLGALCCVRRAPADVPKPTSPHTHAQAL